MAQAVEMTQADPVADKLTDWEKEPTLAQLKQDVEDANTNHMGKVGQINEWLDNMHVRGNAKPKKVEGKSSIQPKLIRKQAEWRYASLSEPFLSSPNIFNVNPVTWEDRDAARQNDLLLNHQFNNKIGKQYFVDMMVRTAVDTGLVIIKIGWKRETKMVKEDHPEIELTPTDDPEVLGIMQQLDHLEQEDPSGYLAVDEGYRVAHAQYKEDGIGYTPEIVGYKEVEVEKVIKNHPVLQVCSYKNVIIDPAAGGNIAEASFVVHKYETTMSALKKDGRYKNLEKIDVSGASPLSEPDFETNAKDTSFQLNDKPRSKIVVTEYWGSRDIDGSGIVTPIVAAWIGNVLIRLELNPFPDQELPFISASYLPVFDSVYGESDGSLLIDNQKIIGAVSRGMVDVMAKSANGQTGVQKGALDAVNRRRFEDGKDYEFNPGNDPRATVHHHTFPELPSSAQWMIQSNNMEAESLTGVQAFSTGITGDALGKTATGARGALDAASKRELGILRRLAEAVILCGRKIVSMNAVFLDDEEIVRITNESFVAIKKDDLGGEFDLDLSISTAEEDNAKAQELAFMLQAGAANLDIGIQKMLLSDIARLRKMPDLAKAIENFEPQPDPLAEAKAQLEIKLLEAQIATEQARAASFGANASLAGQKIGTEAAKANHLNTAADLNSLQFVEQETGTEHERARDLLNTQAESQGRLQMLQSVIRQNEPAQMNKPGAN